MRNQADAQSAFFLHRVRLRLEPGEINEGFRDENHEEAANITVEKIRDVGLKAVRYLNVREDVGGLSLAVAPRRSPRSRRCRFPYRA